ncbi:outer membrane porin, OprD family [Pseudomonas synxantha]|nr:outer membrane porin, OprD family [Pseudomonas synxantha]
MVEKAIATTFVLNSIMLSAQAYADFLSDGTATLEMKNFYFNNDNRNGTATPSKTEEWAQGFMLDYKSGYTDGRLWRLPRMRARVDLPILAFPRTTIRWQTSCREQSW